MGFLHFAWHLKKLQATLTSRPRSILHCSKVFSQERTQFSLSPSLWHGGGEGEGAEGGGGSGESSKGVGEGSGDGSGDGSGTDRAWRLALLLVTRRRHLEARRA